MFISQSCKVFSQRSRLLKSPISGKRDYQNIWVSKPFKMVTSIYDTKVSNKISPEKFVCPEEKLHTTFQSYEITKTGSVRATMMILSLNIEKEALYKA